MTERGDAADLAALARLRDRMNDADNAGDARAFAECLTEDVVIMAPGIPPLIDRGTCLAFVEDVFASYPRRHFEETRLQNTLKGLSNALVQFNYLRKYFLHHIFESLTAEAVDRVVIRLLHG